MNIYETKKKAFLDLQGKIFARKTLEITAISGYFIRKYGFSGKILEKMLDQMVKEGLIAIDGKAVINLRYEENRVSAAEEEEFREVMDNVHGQTDNDQD